MIFPNNLGPLFGILASVTFHLIPADFLGQHMDLVVQ